MSSLLLTIFMVVRKLIALSTISIHGPAYAALYPRSPHHAKAPEKPAMSPGPTYPPALTTGYFPAPVVSNGIYAPFQPVAETLMEEPVVTFCALMAVASVGCRNGVGKEITAPPYTAAAGMT